MSVGTVSRAAGKATSVVTKGRHDPCVGIRALPIAVAMMALVLMDYYMRQVSLQGQALKNASVMPC